MARALWTGSISFGLVQIPVGLWRAESSNSEELSFTLLDARDHSPVGYRQVNKNTGEEVPKEQRVKGYEVSKGKFAILDEEDFKRANPKRTETIEIVGFVDVAEIPVTRFEKPYYVAPEAKGAKAYALLHEALVQSNTAGIATFVLRNRQHEAALVPLGDDLVLDILRYADEVAKAPAHEHAPKTNAAELTMALQLVEGMRAKFDDIVVEDTYRKELLALIEEKAAHPETVRAVPKKPHDKSEGGAVVDMMALLKKSVAERSSAPSHQTHTHAHAHAPAHAKKKKSAS